MASAQEARTPPARPPPPQSRSANRQSQSNGDRSIDGLASQAPIQTFSKLKDVHESIYDFVNIGLEQDEKGQTDSAAINYKEALRLMEKALRVNCEKLLQCTADQIDQAKMMLQKMNKTRQQITFRLQTIQTEETKQMDAQIPEQVNLPSYDEAISEASAPPSYLEDQMSSLGNSIHESEQSSRTDIAHGTSVYSIADGVQIFYISPEGFVSAPSYPSSLNVIKFEDEQTSQASNGQSPPAFLHVGDWMYPLVPGSSPALHTSYGAYIFPDLMSNQPGAAVGLLLPSSLSVPEQQQFESVIKSFTVLQDQTIEPIGEPHQVETPEQDMYTKVASGISTAAGWVTWGLEKGAEHAGKLIKAGSEKIREKTRPAEEHRKIDPRIQQGVIYARQATNATVKVTGFIVNKLGEATMALARQVAPRLRKEGEKVIPKSLSKEDNNGKSKLDGIIEVAASGLKGFGTVYMGLETAAKTLGKSLANETVTVVQHKYGDEAGNLTENTVYTVGNAAMTAYNANNLGVKAIAKRTAKDTGKAVIEDLHQNRKKSEPTLAKQVCESNNSNSVESKGAHKM